MSNRAKASIQSIDRAAAILKALASGPRRLGVSELIFDFRSESQTESLDRMERFAQSIGLSA